MGYTDTTNYKMKKPDASNKFDVADLNNALDTMDTEMFRVETETKNELAVNDAENKKLISDNDAENKKLINDYNVENKSLIDGLNTRVGDVEKAVSSNDMTWKPSSISAEKTEYHEVWLHIVISRVHGGYYSYFTGSGEANTIIPLVGEKSYLISIPYGIYEQVTEPGDPYDSEPYIGVWKGQINVSKTGVITLESKGDYGATNHGSESVARVGGGYIDSFSITECFVR